MTPLLRKLLLIDLFKYHKLKMASAVLFFLLIFAWIFPFSDLSDFVTNFVSTQTRGQVFVQFNRLDFGFLPTVSIEGEDILLDVAATPTLQIDRLQIWPSLTSLLALRNNPNQIPNLSVQATGIFDGDIFAAVKNAKAKQEDLQLKTVEINAENVNLGKVSPLASLPLTIQGRANLKGEVVVNPEMQVQPEGDLQLDGKQVKIPPGNLPTQMGPIFLPGFSWTQVQLKTRLSNGVIYVEQATLGTSTDPIFLQVKGQLRLPIQTRGAQLQSYDLKMDLQINSKTAEELKSFLLFLERFKSPSAPGTHRYMFRAASNNPMAGGPNLQPLSNF